MEVNYRVKLDAYSGPLDLLLYLVRRHEIDLHDIPIAELTEQYLHHLEIMNQINVEVAGEFLVMAATLLEIKSRILVPSAEVSEDDPAERNAILDPRTDLVQQLLAYKRFKDAALELDDRREQWQSRFAHRPGRSHQAADPADDAVAEPIEIDLEDIHVLDLCEAFAGILESIGKGPATHEVIMDDTPVALHAEDLVDRLDRDGPMTLQQVFVGRATHSEMIGLFLAMLELVRQHRLQINQQRAGGDIHLELIDPAEQHRLAEQDEATHDWRNPETGEIEYTWPSEEARLRAESRVTRRIERFKKQKFDGNAGNDEDDIIDISSDDDDSAGEDHGTTHLGG